ncbi:uncharacterized protein LAESUDRAFT_755190 [Laetiporus sulphureus 93-53]|uniref:Uncharacterized protein n=1 Tax=Laetiporus sulphureus 93-53 TaxID=1314785 RepID=A0A165HCM5_9APHY|nr:uncharacterized protein LAESUDRAFT_755190 [Laetiporus sulphureus 93-53]KZT11551.1 hypothetical protein LAESUDRAFT_755190 [Laetiporus sulphureus 93-53]
MSLTHRQHRVQRIYPPVVMHHCFDAERLLTLSISPLRHEYSLRAAIPVPSITFTSPSADPTPINPQLIIRKPKGEVTRLSREGYNLRDALGWTEAVYLHVQTAIHKLAGNHLTPVPFLKQKAVDLQKVYDLAADTYPILRQYENNWVTSDFLRVFLKNKSAAIKRKTAVSS